MAGETQITVIGNLTSDPELKFISSGAAVCNFTVASTPRTFDRQTNEWKDGETLFMRCSLWREAAENVAESLTKGMRVIVQGRLVARSWEANGEKRTVNEIQVDEVGPSLRYATAKVTRTQRGGGGGFGGGGGGGQQSSGGFGGGGYGAPSPAGGSSNDPWATAPASNEPPF
ncbi:single-stranded DNA-binding protein [Demequina pelophila]|uniref:single-stranded DNA-binding protein n=1 Tax=Demequina pelophila TaxID=1638984 RepID=UPI000785334B|nr:single-stranded DNA-binding protein [Demequina pelophila]